VPSVEASSMRMSWASCPTVSAILGRKRSRSAPALYRGATTEIAAIGERAPAMSRSALTET
jgi:hypothetical protein